MPKSFDKTKGSQKRKKSTNSVSNTESDGSETKQCPQKKKTRKKGSALEGIAMSKQLAKEMKNKKVVRSRNPSKNNNKPRLLGNGKPMPSLDELEAMYEDSDSRCSSPEIKPLLSDKIISGSPETLLKLTSKAIDILSKKVIELDDDEPPPPVIPQKKPKKNDEPYIVGCAERPQVPWKPKSKWCIGSGDYGVDQNQLSDEEEPNKRKKRGQPTNISKSIFNAKSDEIAERLKELEKFEVVQGSPDSNKTVEYDFPSNSPTNMTRSFSPLPSTSRDSDTILKNDMLFNESLQNESIPSESLANKNDSQDDIEIIDIPYETIVIDDTLPNVSVKLEKRPYVDLDDDCCILMEPEIKKKRHSKSPAKADSPPKDDIYGSIDLTQPFIDNEVYEINDDDIDDVIAESKAILEKDLKKNSIDTVTAVTVDPNVIVVNTENENLEPPSNITPSTLITNNPESICHPTGIAECVEIETSVPESSNDVQPTVSQDTRNEGIAEVVTNFFNQPQSCDNNSKRLSEGRSIDLTNSTTQDSMITRISSWIHSLESFLTGHPKPSLNTSNDVVCVNDTAAGTRNIRLVVANLPQLHTGSAPPRSRDHERSVIITSCSPNQNARSSNNTQTEPSFCQANNTNQTCCLQGSTHDLANNQKGKNTLPTASSVPNIQQQISSSVTSETRPSHRGLGECPICMDSLANTTMASTLCGHVFCMPCIKAALRANGKKCPTCRKPLKGKDCYHQLFI